MGCHTWFYTLADPQPTYEEIRSKLIDLYKSEQGYYQRHLSGTLDEDEAFLFEDKTIQESTHAVQVLDRLIRRLENRTCKVATLRRVYQIGSYTYCETNGLIYKPVRNFEDLFRNPYSDVELLSFEDTIKFIEQNSDRVWFAYSAEITMQKLRQFWDENPNGMINFC